MTDQLERDEKLRRRVFQLTAGLVGALAVGALVIGGLVLELKSTEHGLARTQVRLVHTQIRLAQDEHSTCMIQARGLPASKHLANAMGELSAVLTPAPGQSLTAVPEPVRRHLGRLREEASAYRALEAQQPSSRSC